MRAGVAIACLVGLALGAPREEEADEELFRARVVGLLEQLASPSEPVRRAAFEGLAACGERAVPLLLHLDAPSPAVAVRVEQLLAPWRRLKLRLLDSEVRLPASIGLRLRASLRNDSRDYWMLPGPGRKGDSSQSAMSIEGLWLVVGDGPPSMVPVETVVVLEEPPPSTLPLLRPGDELRFEVVLPPGASPVRTGGTHRVRLRLDVLAERYPAWLVEPGSVELPGEPAWSDLVPVAEESPPCTVVLVVRSPLEIEQALLSSDLGERRLAVLELRAREDPALLPLLRRFASRPEVRPIAVARMGTAALPEDYPFLERLAKHEKDPGVRLLAIAALGGYATADARWALMGLSNTGGDEVRLAAVEALRFHRHPETVERFLDLLGGQRWRRDPQTCSVIRNTLREWTGIDVVTPEDVGGFRRWWKEHRGSWVAENADLIRDRGR